jgi:endoglucanase
MDTPSKSKRRGASSLLVLIAMALAAAPRAAAAGPASDGAAAPPPDSPVARHGRLGVADGRLIDEAGSPVQLRGMSTAGLQWFGGVVDRAAFAALAKDWKCDVVRLALYVGENGYAARADLKDLVKKGVDLATELGLYVIIDWHVLNPGDPTHPVYSGALAFFEEMAAAYGSRANVIYEIMNEPNGGVTWEGGLKSYAEDLVAAIRAIDPDNLILIGSGTWSQDVDQAAADPVDGTNLMYTAHFYAGTHGEGLRQKISRALDLGAAVFISEWGTSRASGTGGVFKRESDEWLDFLDERGISWVNWSLCNKDETSAALESGKQGAKKRAPLVPDSPGQDGLAVWSAQQLSESGAYVRERIRAGR